MARFSERIGAKPPKTVLQLEAMDDDLRNGLWNVCYLNCLAGLSELFLPLRSSSSLAMLITRLWGLYLKRPLDSLPLVGTEIFKSIHHYYFKKANCAEV